MCDSLPSQVHRALENGVSMWPKLEGRFPQVNCPDSLEVRIPLIQVSGITFAFDPSKPPGSRVDPEFVKVERFNIS